MKTPQFVSLGHIVDNLDHLRIPLNATERGTRKGDFPYWGANNIVDYIDDYTINEPVVLIGEDGAPFLETGRNVAFSVNGPIWPNNHIHVMRPLEGHSPDYIAYALNTVDYSLYVTGSTRLKLTRSSLDRIRIPYYDLPTQRRIADYLDRETAQIDAMAEALDGLVARLEERYARVVEEGTRLDIPHLPLGYCASIYNGSTPSRSRTDFWRDTPGVAWLNSSAVNQVPVTCPSRYVTNTAISECHLPEVRRGDLLMGITGQGRTRGMVSISSIPGTISQHVASIRLNERAHPRFMFWVLKSRYGTIRMNSEGSGSTKGAVTLDEIKRISVPLPPLDEQRRIADHLDAETAKIDAMIAKAGELRALLDERRSALITATVTGQHPVPEEH